ncbi:MAG: glutamyl-tRNA reductase [Candidatus Bathyarchaeota archaeon]|nr:glutamyl-tRNA reductase [Candidatus Bathyarchaeota archaeon]
MIGCLSVSHKNASLPLLEALKINDETKFTHKLMENGSVQECILHQTCHRVEVFYVSSKQKNGEAVNNALKFWSTETGVSLDIISRTVQAFQGKEALRHLFYLGGGLESVVIGEDQILGQVHSSWRRAKANGTVGVILNRAFMKAINTGRKIRNETRINEGALSISSAAVDLAAKELGDLTSRKALIIGAGEAGTLAAETLKSKSAAAIMVANRSYEKSLLLAQKISGEAVQFESVLSTMPYVDLVIAAVSVTQPIFREEQVSAFVHSFEPSKRLLIIDISQPRAVEEKVGALQGISLRTIDDLKKLVAQNLKNREAEAEKSKAIIAEELERFEAELSKLVAQPLITDICRKFEEIRKKELDRAVRKMGKLDKKKLMVLDRFSRELTERIAHIPIEQLREAALSNNGEVLTVAEKIFQTKTSEPTNEINAAKKVAYEFVI